METRPTNLFIESHHLQGAREMLTRLMDYYKILPKLKSGREDAIYVEAELRCILLSKENTRRFLAFGCDGIRFRNHARDKKGKLVSVEAYYETTK